MQDSSKLPLSPPETIEDIDEELASDLISNASDSVEYKAEHSFKHDAHIDSADIFANTQSRIEQKAQTQEIISPRFTHLRCHSEYSIVDGIVRIDDYI